MGQNIPDKSFDRSMNHNYMILSKRDFFNANGAQSSDYRVRMLLENKIPGLLPVTHRMIDGESRYYYEISSLQSLDRLLEKKEIGYEELRALLTGCISLFDKLEEYLLDGSQIIMKAEYIYINVDKMEPYFVCYPDYKEDVRVSFMEFIDALLVKINHEDERAVLLGYQVYRYTRNPNYVLYEIQHMMEHVIEEAARNVSAQECFCTDTNGCEEKMGIDFEEYIPKNAIDYGNGALQEKSEQEPNIGDPAGNKSDIIGGILCLFIALSAAVVLAGVRITGSIQLSEKQTLYLYGAIVMAAVAVIIFFICYMKKRHAQKNIAELEACREKDDFKEIFWTEAPKINQIERAYSSTERPACNETVCLGNNVVEERILRGYIGGKEVSVSLEYLPMTVGKLKKFADYVIDDDTVSKMHARFEEHDGRVFLSDLNSTNGTVKNGVMIDINKPVPLEVGDRIRFGRTSFIYC